MKLEIISMKIYKILIPILIIIAFFEFFWIISADSSAQTITQPEQNLQIEEPVEPIMELESLGEFKISHYCVENYPHICNNGDSTHTATGTLTTPGRTVAVDPKMIPYGTELMINGHSYIAEDCGGSIKDRRIDICVNTHAEALQKGIDYCEVFLITWR